jgi:hypothetical protein
VSPAPGSLGIGASGGGAIAVWIAGGGPGGIGVVRASIKPPGAAAFGPEATLSAPQSGLRGPIGTTAPDGQAVAAWIDGDFPIGINGVLRVAEFTERPGAVLEPPPVAVRIDDAPSAAVEGSLVRFNLVVDGFADALTVRLQRRISGAFRDTGRSAILDGTSGELSIRLDFPGTGVFRLAYERGGQPALTRPVTIRVSRPGRPLIPAGTRPTAVRVGLGHVWVLTQDDAGEGVVLRLDQRTGRQVGEPTPVGRAVGLAVGAGAVWVSRGLEADRGVIRLDPTTGAVVAEIPVTGHGAIAAGPAGVWTVDCNRVSGLFASCGEQRLARIDPATNAISERFTVVEANRDFSPSAGGLAVGRSGVWFSVVDDDGGRYARRLDLAAGTIADVGSAVGLVARGDVVWGLSGRRCELFRGRGAGELVARGRVAGLPRFGCDHLTFDGRSVWTSQSPGTAGSGSAPGRVASRLVRLDARTARPVGRPIATAFGPVSIGVGAGAVWAASADEAAVRRIDPRPAARGVPSVRPYRTPRARAAWLRPATIPGSTARHGIAGLDVAAGGRGRAAAIWQRLARRGDPDVVSAIRPSAARGWAGARRLGTGDTNSFAGGPRVDMNAAGEGLAIWVRGGAGLGGSAVQAASLTPGARTWAAPATLSEAGTGGLAPDAALSADGESVAVWSCLCIAGRGPATLRQAVRPPGGAFGAAAPLGSAGTGVGFDGPVLAMAPNGGATAAWGGILGGGISAASRAPGAAFGDAATIVPPAVIGPAGASVAVNDAGRAIAVWQYNGLFAALRGADGAWSAPERIAPAGGASTTKPQVALDAAGNAVVATLAFDPETFNNRVLSVARRAGADSWEAPVWLSPKGPTEGPPGPSAGDPSIAMNARGDVVVAWPQRLGGVGRALARLRPAGRPAWRPLEAISGRERSVEAVRVAIDAAGRATAAWVARLEARRTGPAAIRVATRPALRAAD